MSAKILSDRHRAEINACTNPADLKAWHIKYQAALDRCHVAGAVTDRIYTRMDGAALDAVIVRQFTIEGAP